MNRAKRSFFVVCLLAMLVVYEPKPANAIFCSNCTNQVWETAKWISEQALWAVQWAAEAAQWVAENTQRSAASVANILKDKLNFEKDMKLAEAEQQGKFDQNVRAELGVIARKNAVPTTSTACTVAAVQSTASNVKMAMNTLGRALARGVGARFAGKDPTTGTNTPVAGSVQADAADVKVSCDMGFVGPSRYGNNVLEKVGCEKGKTDATYVDADVNVDSLLNPMQYYMPASAKLQGNGYVFSSIADNEKPWAAAYYFCQNVAPDIPTPTRTEGTVVTDDIVSMRADRTNMATRSGAVRECMRALTYRTACPSGVNGVLKDANGKGCHDHQVTLCNLLRNGSAAGGGYVLTFDSNPEYEAALNECNSKGLSLAMYDAILANRCSSSNYIAMLQANLKDAAEVTKAVEFDCREAVSTWERKLDNERASVLSAVQTLLDLRNSSLRGATGAASRVITP